MDQRTGPNLSERQGQLFVGLTMALCDAVTAQIRLNTPDKNGVTQREHVEQLARQLHISPDIALEQFGLMEPEVPPEASHVWQSFWELCEGRTNNGFGPNPLSWESMQSYAALCGLTFTPWHSQTLRSMDNAFLNAQPQQK